MSDTAIDALGPEYNLPGLPAPITLCADCSNGVIVTLMVSTVARTIAVIRPKFTRTLFIW